MSAKTRQLNNTFSPDLTLTPDQQELLLTALTSNRPTATNHHPDSFMKSLNIINPGANHPANSSATPTALVDTTSADAKAFQSSIQASPGSGKSSSGNLDKSPFLDYDFDEANVDWDPNGESLFGNLPETLNEDDGDLHDKRKTLGDERDGEENGNKRREGEDKSAKKPGRKPLTEPTTKRKAQNRAAQRAFRERKERHLKDLETKVEDLEKASEAVNHENGRLRAQVDRLNLELKEYRKRLSLNGTGGGSSPPSAASISQSRNLYNNSFDIQFAFPKFGDLPGSNFMSNGSLTKVGAPGRTTQQPASSVIPGILRTQSSNSVNVESPANLNGSFHIASPEPLVYPSPTNTTDDFGELGGLFSPSILETASRSNSSDYMGFQSNRKISYPETAISRNDGPARSSLNSKASPSVSSISNNGLDSSCGTTPEPSADSPDNRKGSEGELRKSPADLTKPEASLNFTSPSMYDINRFDWMAQQNGGQFDPVLFGGYRDPQENILNNYDPNFFNDAFNDGDFTMPYYTGDPMSPLVKRNPIKETELQQNGSEGKVAPKNKSDQPLPCEKLFDRVPESEKHPGKDFDLDSLCSQFKSKAKCSQNGGMDPKEANKMFSSAPTPGESDAFKMFA